MTVNTSAFSEVYFVVTGGEFCWLLHERTGISNSHELQKYSIQDSQTVWEKCQRLLSAFVSVRHFSW